MHFEDRLEDGKMIFDYRMRPGVVGAQQRARAHAGDRPGRVEAAFVSGDEKAI